MDAATIIATAIGVILGGIITWVVAWVYYKKAGDELLVESRKLKNTADLILYKLQHPNAKTALKYNEKGEVTGMTIDMQAKL